MNDKRRSSLKLAVRHLKRASDIVESAADEEQDCLDCIPENLQNTDRYTSMEDAVDSLNDALSSIDDSIEKIEGII